MKAIISDEELQKRVEAYQRLGSYKRAGEELGIDESRVRDSVRKATRRKMTGEFLGDPLPAGYILGKVTSLVGADGIMMEWQHKLPEAEALQEFFDTLLEMFKADVTPLPEIEAGVGYSDDLLVLYPVVDVHLGMYAWGKETGKSWDLNIAKEEFLHNTSALFTMTPPAQTALIVVLGDFYHADNNNAETEKSKNHLDVDSRHDKVLHLGAELIVWQVDRALQKHHNVIVKVMRGNHDPNSSRALTMALWFRYQNNPRVTVERDPVELWTYPFGVNMLSFTHGDKIKAEDMPGVMAAFEPEIWGNTRFRFGYSGHFHRQKKGPLSDEKHGATWEILPAFTEKDAWNKSMGFTGRRVIVAKTFHKKDGLKYTTEVSI